MGADLNETRITVRIRASRELGMEWDVGAAFSADPTIGMEVSNTQSNGPNGNGTTRPNCRPRG
jgi:hypothetical protein